jgi:hypothetical protein
MRLLEDVLAKTFDLDLSGWTLLEATAISDDGETIVGLGIGPGGFQQAWIASSLPEPSPALLAPSALAASLVLRHVRRRRDRPR